MRGAPVEPAEYDPEHPHTDETLEADGWATGLDVWEQVGKAYEWYGACDGDESLQNAQLWSLREAIRAELRTEMGAGDAA
jgi:hypothetical protein